MENEYQNLLKDLKTTVEGLLVSQVTNIWNVYGGLSRLHRAIEAIFLHQCKLFGSNGEPDCLTFIQGLIWLQPNSSSVDIESEYQSYIPVHLKSNPASIWLYRSLENHSLSQKLSWLLSDLEHLYSCYEKTAFLCQEKYSEATLICLRAVEQYQPNLLSEINPSLFINNLLYNKDSGKTHRRSVSFPTVGLRPDWPKTKSSTSQTIASSCVELSENSEVDAPQSLHKNDNERSKVIQDNHVLKYSKIKPWNSLPSLNMHKDNNLPLSLGRRATMSQFKTEPNTPQKALFSQKLSPSLLQVDYSKLHRESSTVINASVPKKSISSPNTQKNILLHDQIQVHNEKISPKIPDGDDQSSRQSISRSSRKMGQISSSEPDYSFIPLTVLVGQKDLKRTPMKRFIDDGGSSITPMATRYFPRPQEGQTLTSFLTSGQFSHISGAELDRENAHFSISEAMIAAIEQVKFNKAMKIHESPTEDETDEEILRLREKIRIRQRKLHGDMFNVQGSVSNSSLSSTSETITGSPSKTDDLDDDETIDDSASNMADLRSISESLVSLYSDVSRRPRGAPDGQSDCVLSAEGVALSLISKFKDKQLPKASELEWLVSESEEVPQALLPLPNSWLVNTDNVSKSPDTTPLRGTVDWAPPRAQIIFTPHPPPNRRELMVKQRYRCAGCGIMVAPQYASKFRYCEYLGRYFCTGCHSNQLALIPGKILTKWNFTRYPVSNFSYQLLEQMNHDPLFNIEDINPSLFQRCKALKKCRHYRLQLYYLKDFIMSCRFAEKVKECLEHREDSYWLLEPDVYSINDLFLIKKGDFLVRLKEEVEVILSHTETCQVSNRTGDRVIRVNVPGQNVRDDLYLDTVFLRIPHGSII